MKFILFSTVIIYLVHNSNTCLPTRTRTHFHSYLPASIQILHHYRDQLLRFYPFALSGYCRRGYFGANAASLPDSGLMKNLTKQFEEKLKLKIPKEADLCVYPTDYRIFLLLSDLHREADNHNLNQYQGFPYKVVLQLEKTSRMSSSEQLYFILNKLLSLDDGGTVTSGDVKCKIIHFMEDLKRPTSKLYRNLLMVEPLNYVIRR